MKPTKLQIQIEKLTDDFLLAMIEYVENLPYNFHNSKILESLNRELTNR